MKLPPDTRPPRRAYDLHIHSDAWAERRQQVFRKRGRRCQACGDRDGEMHLHHATYERFAEEADDDLVVLCEPCHDTLHRFQRFTRLPLAEATRRFLLQPELRKAMPTRRPKRPHHRAAAGVTRGGVTRYRQLTPDEAARAIRDSRPRRTQPDLAALEQLAELLPRGEGG